MQRRIGGTLYGPGDIYLTPVVERGEETRWPPTGPVVYVTKQPDTLAHMVVDGMPVGPRCGVRVELWAADIREGRTTGAWIYMQMPRVHWNPLDEEWQTTEGRTFDPGFPVPSDAGERHQWFFFASDHAPPEGGS